MDRIPTARIETEPGGVSFSGIYQHAIDAKGRTSLPSRFRELLAAQGAEKLFVTTDLFDDCLQAYTPAQWTAFTERVAGLKQFDPAVRQIIRAYVAPAQECPVDKLGRILIPPTLRAHAGLVADVTWAGSIERIEIWAPDAWARTIAKAGTPEVKADLAQRIHQLL